jgi:VanZ family protein
MGRPEAGLFVRAFQSLGRALQRIPRGGAVLGALAWLAVIWFVSSRPPPSIGPGGPFTGVLANLAHAPEYGILVLWIALALPRRGGWPVLDARAIAAILAGVALWAVLDEVHQSFTPHRDASAFDALTDFVGASATLSCIVAAGGPRASSRELAIRFVVGFFACVLAASLATFAPESFPGASWL